MSAVHRRVKRHGSMDAVDASVGSVKLSARRVGRIRLRLVCGQNPAAEDTEAAILWANRLSWKLGQLMFSVFVSSALFWSNVFRGFSGTGRSWLIVGYVIAMLLFLYIMFERVMIRRWLRREGVPISGTQ